MTIIVNSQHSGLGKVRIVLQMVKQLKRFVQDISGVGRSCTLWPDKFLYVIRQYQTNVSFSTVGVERSDR